MNKIHEPNQDFVDKLEWQLSSEFRRQSRLKSAPVKKNNFRFFKTTGIVFCSMMAGVVFLKAAEHVKDSWKRDLEMARVETALQLKEAKLKMFKGMILEIKTKVEKGLVEKNELFMLENNKKRMNMELEKARLNFKEVQESGRAPRNELYAPKIGKEDFVGKRLKLDKKIMGLRLNLIEGQKQRVKNLVKAGMVHQQELDVFKKQLSRPLNQIDVIDYKLSLRSDFLKGKLSAQEVSVKEKMENVKVNLKTAEVRFQIIEAQAKRVKALVKDGRLSKKELNSVEYGLLAAGTELRLAKMELEFLQNIKE